MSPLRDFSTNQTPQNEQADPAQVQNSAGGFSFAIDQWKRLQRFLILGSDGGSYYASERSLTADNAGVVFECLRIDAKRTIDTAVEVSVKGRAASNDPAIFVLALATGMDQCREQALRALPQVCRIGTHLFTYMQMIQNNVGSWNRTMRRGVGAWYDDRDTDKLAYQLVKYRQRNGWSHSDVMRLAHPRSQDPAHAAMYGWVRRGDTEPAALPELVRAFTRMNATTDESEAIHLISTHGLPWETVPTQLRTTGVWQALLETGNLPLGATVRNLGVMTARGTLQPLSGTTKLVVDRLSDVDEIGRARLHPLAILNALHTYNQGTSRGGLTWTPVPQISQALDSAFYLAFETVESANKRTLIGLDVSGSMGWGTVGGVLSPRVASAALSMVTVRTEPQSHVMAFCDKFVPVNIAPHDTLETVLSKTDHLPFGGTDCALPMIWAREKSVEVDTFVVYTDNETWFGDIHPHQALRDYRKSSGIDARLVVCGMVANQFSIADPADGGMLDVVGFSTDTPNIISQFSARAI